MIQISDLILEFRDFITLSWPSLEKLEDHDESYYYKENCIEAIWELVLEPVLATKLETYVYIQQYWLDGAEIYPKSSRAFFPDVKEANYEIFCLPKNNEFFFEFVYKKKIFLNNPGALSPGLGSNSDCPTLTQGESLEQNYFQFSHFVTLSENESMPPMEEPPFDYAVCISGKEEVIFKVDSCEFYIKKIEGEAKQG